MTVKSGHFIKIAILAKKNRTAHAFECLYLKFNIMFHFEIKHCGAIEHRKTLMSMLFQLKVKN